MSSSNSLKRKYFELVQMQITINYQAAKWQESLMYKLADIFSTNDERKKMISSANKILKASLLQPHENSLQDSQTRLYWESLNKRWNWVGKEFQRFKISRGMRSSFSALNISNWFESYANNITAILNYIDQFGLDQCNVDDGEPGDFFTVYCYRLDKKVRVAMMKDTLSRSMTSRKRARQVQDSELSFFCEQLEKDWSKKLEAYQMGNRSIFGFLSVDETMNKASCPFKLCTPIDVQNCVESIGSKLSRLDKRMFEQMIEQDGVVSLATVPEEFSSILVKFRSRFPNMLDLADLIEGHLNLMTLGNADAPLELSSRPLILDGPPGIGKTMALRFLSDAFGVAYRVIGCAELTNGFDISGQSRGWSSGKLGMVARMLIYDQSPNGIIVLDEVDKCHTSTSNFPPVQALYSLLEKGTSEHFIDEFLEFEVNASQINWLATSNYFELIPEPIRDRARRVEISTPTMQQRISISQFLYVDLIEKNKDTWGKFFIDELSDEIAFMIASVPDISVRGMRDVLLDCLTIVASSSRKSLDIASQAVTVDQAAKVIKTIQMCSNDSGRIGFIH